MDFERQKKLAERFEGRRSFAYQCSAGKLTIGVGRNVDEAGGKGLSDAEIDILLENDLRECTEWLSQNYDWFEGLDDVRRAVLIDMRFNLGPERFSKFKNMLKFIAGGNYMATAAEMLDSLWALQVGRRSLILADMMRSGEWPKL